MKNNLGLSISTPNETVFKSGLFSCVEYAKAFLNDESGFDAIKEEAEKLKELSKKYGVKVHSFHLPFCGKEKSPVFYAASLDKEERKKTLENSKRLIVDMLPTGIEFVIIHGGVSFSTETTKQQLDAYIDYIKNLADFCKPYGITVAVETLKTDRIPCGSEQLLYILEKTDRENVGICFDSNHFLLENNIEFLKKAGEFVVTTHLSDYDGVEEKHWFPGKGVTDWKKLVEVLNEKGYTGPYLFEVKFKEKEPTDAEITELVCEWENLF